MAPPHSLSRSRSLHSRAAVALLLFSIAHPFVSPAPASLSPRRFLALVPATPLTLAYHNGPLLSSRNSINVYVLWYGSFSPAQKSVVLDFLSSFSSPAPPQPAVSTWWKTATSYKDKSNAGVPRSLLLAGQTDDAACSVGKNLKRAGVATLVQRSVASKAFPTDPNAVYLVLSAADVYVEDFCMHSCGFHDSVVVGANAALPYAWVGNSATQCPGECAWPYAIPQFGPQSPPLVSPNKDVGMDGMIINVAALLAGAATNPFDTGYFQGDPEVPLEAVSACTGIFGEGSYPGYPGELLVDKSSGASFNAHGVNGRMFLLPAMWDPTSHSCATLP